MRLLIFEIFPIIPSPFRWGRVRVGVESPLPRWLVLLQFRHWTQNVLRVIFSAIDHDGYVTLVR